MADGHIGKCKTCSKKDAVERYQNPIFRAKIKDYDQKRAQTEHRKKWRKINERNYREKNSAKYRCRYWTNNAVRDGRIIKKPCEICGNLNSESHHEDYTKPSKIRWLCFKHHREIGHGQKIE